MSLPTHSVRRAATPAAEAPVRLHAAPHGRQHVVQFYDDEETLRTVVAGFVAEGLQARQPTVAIVRGTRHAAIVERLAFREIDVARSPPS